MDVVSNRGWTPLHWAIRNDDKECARLLINSGAHIANVKLDEYPSDDDEDDYDEDGLYAIPDWAIAMEREKEVCRHTALLILALHRKRRVALFRGIDANVMRMIAQLVWGSRGNEQWAQSLNATNGDKRVRK